MRAKRARLIAGLALLLASCGGTASVGSPAGSGAGAASTSPAAAGAASAKGSSSSSTTAAGSAAAPASSSAAAGASAAGAGKASGTPIKIGVIADISGVFADLGAEMHINTDLVINRVNSSGGIDGHPLQVEYVDAKGDPAQAINAATKFVQQDKVDVLMGAASSAECIGVEKLAPKLSTVYVIDTCSADDITAQNCNKYTFRVASAGRQLSDPMAAYMVKTYGKSWAMVYPDYALGQSSVKAYGEALTKLGGELKAKIPIPLNESNESPYISKIPTDGSVVGVIEGQGGADLARSLTAMQQFGITKKLHLVLGAGGLEHFGGQYPALLTGAVENGLEPSSPEPGNTFSEQFHKAFSEQAAKDSQAAGILGGAAKATPGNVLGYSSYISVTALMQAMKASHFTGRADNDKLISALASLKGTKSLDFPAGDVIMNPDDHQGRSPIYILKINGNKEDILSVVPADQVPQIGSCKIS